MERIKSRDILTIGTTVLGLYALSLCSFTKAQRQAILERDNHKCQFPADHPCNGKAQLQVHHILGQRYAKKLGFDPDFAENGITLCETAHQEIIHPDMKEAREHYHDDPLAYDKAFQKREELLDKKEITWNDKFDRVLHVMAIRNSQRARLMGWIFPDKGKKD